MNKNIIIILLCILLSLSACKKKESKKNIYYHLANEIITENYVVGQEKDLISTSKDGYEFLGWTLNYEGLGPIKEKITKEDNDDIHLFPMFEIIYQVTFNSNGGLIDKDVITFTKSSIPSLPSPIKDGYKFVGWYENDILVTSLKDRDYILYAKYEESVTNITYNLNHGKFGLVSLSTIDELKYEFFNDLYQFLGNSFSYDMFVHGNKNDLSMGRWYLNYKTRIFENNNKDINLNDSSFFLNNSTNYYKWIGFFNELAAINDNYYDTSFWDNNQTIAKKIIDLFTGNFSKEDTMKVVNSVKVNQQVKLQLTSSDLPYTLPTPENGDYEFLGFYDNESCAGNQIKVIDKLEDITLYALWGDGIDLSSITIENSDNYLCIGDSIDLVINAYPSDAFNKNVVIESSNSNVVQVSKKTLVGKSYGTSIITVYSEYDESINVSFTISVIPYLDDIVIYSKDGELGFDIIKVGQRFNALQDVFAYSKTRGDITLELCASGDIDTTNVGEYEIEYYVTENSNKYTCKHLVIVNELIYAAHRGSKFKGVENSKEAFLNAIEMGYKALETDVKVTKDGVLVIWHDDDFNQTRYYVDSKYTKYKIAEHTYDELKEIVIHQTIDKVTYSSTLLTYDEFLSICYEHDVIPIIESKKGTGMTDSDQSNVHLLVDKIYEYNLQDKAIIIAFEKNVIDYVKNTLHYDNVQLLLNESYRSYLDFCFENRINASIKWEYVSLEIINEFHKRGLFVNTWTINSSQSKALMSKFIMWGIDYITSDDVLSLDDVTRV